MLSLKALKDDEIRQKAEADRQRRILDIVKKIYNEAKTVAETTTLTSYSYKVPVERDLGDPYKVPEQRDLCDRLYYENSLYNENRLYNERRAQIIMSRMNRSSHSHTPDEFYVNNMVDILTSLRDLFPGCAVNYSVRSFATSVDGKEHDVTTGAAHIFPTLRQRREEVIVVDWS
jgi:hypothetical protein